MRRARVILGAANGEPCAVDVVGDSASACATDMHAIVATLRAGARRRTWSFGHGRTAAAGGSERVVVAARVGTGLETIAIDPGAGADRVRGDRDHRGAGGDWPLLDPDHRGGGQDPPSA